VNEISAAANGEGEALFVLQEVLPESDLTVASTRRLGQRAFRYAEGRGGWVLDSAGQDLKLTWLNTLHGLSIPGCRMASGVQGYELPNCNRWPAQAAIFSGGEAVVVWPAPATERADAGSSPLIATSPEYENIQLYSVGYR
jgi:hypothetical protein